MAKKLFQNRDGLSEPAPDPTVADQPVSDATIEQILERLPALTGIYIMKDAADKVIYIGKAANLRTRVRSYFRDSGDQRFTVRFIRGRVTAIDTIVTETEKEALLLENVLIKKHKPRYNMQLRDDKTYISLRLDLSHELPRVHRARRRGENDKAMFFGPFSSSAAVKDTMRFVQKLFPLRSCPDHVLSNRSRPCILHQIDRCSAPCVGLVAPEKYREYVDETILFLNGKKEHVVDLLRRKMWEYSEAMLFEKAAAVRNKILAIEKTIEKEMVVSHRVFNRDVIGLAREQGRMVLLAMNFRAGNLEESRAFEFRDLGLPDDEVVEAFLGQYYDGARDVPRDVIVAADPANREMLLKGLNDLRGGPVRILHPERGDKVRLIAMANQNAALELERRLAGEKSREQVLGDLQRGLKLPRLPSRIECFDISNFQGSFAAGSMTCFVDGNPDKTQYRHFKIRSVVGQDDFASMREVLTRRYSRALKEDGPLPDLIVIDGGKGQLNIAVEVLKELGLFEKIPICGLAKSRLLASKEGVHVKVRTEERVFMPMRKDAVRFNQSDPALFILTRIRDEAHRFGVAYHRKLRSMSSLRSGLEELPGIGPKRRRALLTHFGSLTRIKAASLEELTAAPGVTPALAGQIIQFFRTPSAKETEAQTELDLEEDETEFAEELAEVTEEELNADTESGQRLRGDVFDEPQDGAT
ncbi:excinuclease ABC subunit UvrC [soil metagenome]